MIKTNYEILLTIDDTDYQINVREPSKVEQIELSKMADEAKNIFNERQQLIFDADEYEKLIAINEAIIETTKDDELKILLLQENKKNISTINKIKAKQKTLDLELPNLEKMIDDAYKKRFEMCVMGENKISLMNIIDSTNLGYQKIFNIFAEQIHAQKEEAKKN